MKTEISHGISLGTAIAVVLSWSINQSIGYMLVHGILSWIYVIYYVLIHG